MPIKLLSKQEINLRQANQKRAEIEEGRKLAVRVDNLRELVAQEEASLASFRAKTLKAINAEIKLANKEKEDVLAEVKILRDELKNGFTSLREAEKEFLAKVEDLVAREYQMTQRIALIETKEAQIKKEFNENKIVGKRIGFALDELKKVNILMDEKIQLAHDMFDDAELKKTQSERMFQRISEELHNKDINVASRERDITIKEERVQRQEKALRQRELQLIDREKTLEREFKRLKK